MNNIAANLSKVSREDIIERSVANFGNADLEFGDRVAGAVTKRRSPRPAAFDGIKPIATDSERAD